MERYKGADQFSTRYPLLMRTAEEASASVVNIFARVGFVIESKPRDGKFMSSVLTTASILRPHPCTNEVRNDSEISVVLANNAICKGVVGEFNFHYNVAIIEIATDVPVGTARLKLIDDSISIDPNAVDQSDQSDKYKLIPGSTVVALGRCCIKRGKYKLMVVGGEFSLCTTRLDCRELFRANFKISQQGIGGPVINSNGEVIGISFFHESFTPFLPINIVSVWWKHLKKNRTCRGPHLRMKLINLYTAGSSYLEEVLQQFPNIHKGVGMFEVASKFRSLAGGIIVKCDEKPVGSILEFFELIWAKIGEPVNLTVLWPADGSSRCVTVTFNDAEQHQMYRWPLGPITSAKIPCYWR